MALGRLPSPKDSRALIDAAMLDATVKGVPAHAGAVRLDAIAAKRWNLLEGDLPLPAAVIRKARLDANNAWMAGFLKANGLHIAPHGKTTMAPQLFAMQMQAGAWAITVATTQQMAVCRTFGIPRVVIANQPVGRAAIDACFAALAGGDGFELYALADSLDVVTAYAEGAQRTKAARPLGVLVEMGVAGGRTGLRDRSAALAVARAVAKAPGLSLAGIECFEGILSDIPAVDRLLDDVLAVATAAAKEDLFAKQAPIVLSAGGSAFYDRVGERFAMADFGGRLLIKLIRSGCYLTHDTLGYAASHERILRETRLKLPPGKLEAALEVWAYVQSRPEPAKAILTMGKRDVSHDAGLPAPIHWYRSGTMSKPEPMPSGHQVTGLNDQHCHMAVPRESPLAVGDMVGFGIGHPCTTFDKWQLMMIVDEDYTVIDAIRTFF
jgi:D-serine dehydratase